MAIQCIAVLGGGAWGTALALTCARAGRDVMLWEHEADNAASLTQKRESRFLPGVRLSETIKITRELGETAGSEAILIVVPAQAMRRILRKIAEDEYGNLGDTSTLADPAVVDDLVSNRQNKKTAKAGA